MRRHARFSCFADVEAYLEGLGLFRMTPGLERMRDVLDTLGLRRPPYAVIQVVGTNGKGSTATMLERLAREHGLSTGLHTSPHFLSVRERVRVNGAMLPEADWTRFGNTLFSRGGEALSYFEFVTCLAVLAFAEADADVAVMESGLGGTFDATTALEADLVAFTPIALDHQAVLGNTLREIAFDKAGAIRPGQPAISAPQKAEARSELLRMALERNAPFEEISPAFSLPSSVEEDGIGLRLAGGHQPGNARLALAAWRMLPRAATEEGIPARVRARIAAACAPRESGMRERTGADAPCVGPNLEAVALASAWLPGRMQCLPARGPGQEIWDPCASGWPPLLLDGAHNSHGLAALGRSLARAGIAPMAVIFSCLADKDPGAMLPHLRALATGLIVVPPIAGNPRAMRPDTLAAQIGLNAVPAGSLREALEIAAGHIAGRMPEVFAPASASAARHPLLICGSLYLLGEFYALRPDTLFETCL